MSICVDIVKIRKLIEITPSMGDLCKYIDDIEQFAETKPNIALDSAKSLLESLSKRFLADRKIIQSKDKDDFHHTLRQAIKSAETIKDIKDTSSLKKLLSGFSSIAQGIGEMRNKYGFYSHGRDTLDDKIHPLFAHFVVNCALSISTFLLNLHNNEHLVKSRLIYNDYILFNTYFDNVSEELKVGDISISPSRTLFYEDEDAYREELKIFYEKKASSLHEFEVNFSEENAAEIILFKGALSEAELDKIDSILKQNSDKYDLFSADTKEQMKALYSVENVPTGYEVKN